MEKIIVHENQFYDIHAPKYKLDVEFSEDKKEATFSVVKFISDTQDERIEEIHLCNEQLIALSKKLNNFLNQQ